MKQLDPPPKTRSLRLANLNVLVNTILYNTPAAFQIIESLSPNFSRLVFDKWFKSMNEPGGLPRVHDMKLSIMAMCGLLELEESNIPPSLKEGWTSIVPALLAVFKQLPDAITREFLAFGLMASANHFLLVERKKMQDELQEDDEEDLDPDEEALILDHGDEGSYFRETQSLRVSHPWAEDVYDEDTAIRDVMAREVCTVISCRGL
jgi:importin-7